MKVNSYKNIEELISDYIAILNTDTSDSVGYFSNQHLINMLIEMDLKFENDELKYMRWLGYVQGVMCVRGLLDVDNERNRTRKMFTEDSWR